MLEKCDICGFQILKGAHYCNGCGVDLLEGKFEEHVKNTKKKIAPQKPDPVKSNEEDPFKTVNWCWLKHMSFGPTLVLMMMLAKGRAKLGFCSCALCNQGYREYLAELRSVNVTEIKANSREIVKEAYGKDLSDVKLNLTGLFGQTTQEKSDSTNSKEIRKSPSGGLFIEIPQEIIEAGIEKVLTGESGKKILRETLKRTRKNSNPATE